MNLANGTALFLRLVRADDLDQEIDHLNLYSCLICCADHGAQKHVAQDSETPICLSCVRRSRALAEMGRKGGKIGGRTVTPKKLQQLDKARQAFCQNAEQRRKGPKL